MISLCIIVKNEEENIEKCLLSAEKYVDEIVIVDTGSSDNTKKIAQKYTDKIYDYKWCGDFSKARNFSISKSSNDWILVLDADEYITDYSIKNINNFISDDKNEKIVGRIERVNITESKAHGKKYKERIERLFNKKYFKYEGIIHEQIVPVNKFENMVPVDITINHIGYMESELKKKDKLQRNLDMLNKAIRINSKDPYLYFQMGKTYYVMKNYNDSILNFEKAISFKPDLKFEYVEDLIETYGYALINSGKYGESLKILNYLDFYKNSADFNFLAGLIYMNNAKFKLAVESFYRCTKLPKGKVEGVNSFLAYHNIKVIKDVLLNR